MRKKFVIGFFLLLLINFSLEFSTDCYSIPESQDNIREWTLLNNENNSVNIEVQESRNISIQYYIEEIEEIDQMRYIVNLNITGDNIIIYGNVSEDKVRIYTLFWVTLFAGDNTDFYYELHILNETVFTIPDYFYNFKWNFTSADPLQFLNLRFYTQYESTDYTSYYFCRGGIWTLIQDEHIISTDNFKNLGTKIKFNLNSKQFITNINFSIDYSKLNHTTVNITNNGINSGDDSIGYTYLSGSMRFMNREQDLINNNGWIQEFSYSYPSLYSISIPELKIYGINSQNSSQLYSNEEISNEPDRFRMYLEIDPIIKVESPLVPFGCISCGYYYYYSTFLVDEFFTYELDNISPSTEFFIKYSRIFKFVGVILGITSLVILTKLYQKRRNLR